MPRILVTGAGGFVGRHCLEPLRRRGWDVVAVRSGAGRAAAEAPPGIAWHLVDLHLVDLLEAGAGARLMAETGPDVLLHLAWSVSAGSVENYHWTRASLQLLTDFAEAGGRRAVLAGSCAEYDWHAAQPLSESSPRRPQTPYGVCKNALGELVDSYRREIGLSAAWARIFFLYGPGEAENRLVASVIRSLQAGEPARSTHGRQRRDYLYVEDLGEALAALVDSDLCGPVNVASGHAIELRELIGEAARQLGRPDLVRLGALEAHPDEAPEVCADVTRLRDEVGWSPRYDHATGLARTIDWWKGRGLEDAR